MRRPIDLDLKTLDDGFATLFHGIVNSGKTHLLGDALKHESQFGPIRYINVKGEDGQMSLASFGLGQGVGETVETTKDMDDVLRDYAKLGLQALALDSLKPLGTMLLFGIVGEDRLPDTALDGEKSKAYWGRARVAMETVLKKLRGLAKYLICVCPSDKSEDIVSKSKSVTPDLFGKLAFGCAGSFDFVGFVEARVVGPGRLRRTISLAPSAEVLTRQRLPRPVLKPIIIPDGSGGWAAYKSALQDGLTGGGETSGGIENGNG